MGGDGTVTNYKNYNMCKYSFHTHIAKWCDLEARVKNWIGAMNTT